MLDSAHLAIVITGLVALIGGLWGFFKFFSLLINRQFDRFEKRADSTDGLIRDLSSQIATMQGGKVGLVTVESCVLNSQQHDARIESKIRDTKTELRGEIGAVEERLSVRISRVEERVA